MSWWRKFYIYTERRMERATDVGDGLIEESTVRGDGVAACVVTNSGGGAVDREGVAAALPDVATHSSAVLSCASAASVTVVSA